MRTQAEAAARKGTESPKQLGLARDLAHIILILLLASSPVTTLVRSKNRSMSKSRSTSRIGQPSDQFQHRRKCWSSNLAQSHFCARRNSTRPAITKEGDSCICGSECAHGSGTKWQVLQTFCAISLAIVQPVASKLTAEHRQLLLGLVVRAAGHWVDEKSVSDRG